MWYVKRSFITGVSFPIQYTKKIVLKNCIFLGLWNQSSLFADIAGIYFLGLWNQSSLFADIAGIYWQFIVKLISVKK